MSKNLFITGTGTDVGKTYVTALIVKKLNQNGRKAGYFKAAMSGNQRRSDGRLIPGDALHVRNVSGILQPLEEMCPYLYENAVSPHLAARIEGNPVRLAIVKEKFEAVTRQYDFVTMEGSGGILAPIVFGEERIFLEDIINMLNLSCLIVADAGLGTINQVGLTAAYMQAKNIPVKGIIFNRFHPGNAMEEDNLEMCEEITDLKVLARVKNGDTELAILPEQLVALYD